MTVLFKTLAAHIKKIEFQLYLWPDCASFVLLRAPKLFLSVYFIFLKYIEEQERNGCEQGLLTCVCFELPKEENLIIPMIKAIIRKKKKTLTQKCLGWKTSRFSLLQPIKRVIKHPHSTHTHTLMHVAFTEPMQNVNWFTGNNAYVRRVHPFAYITNAKYA